MRPRFGIYKTVYPLYSETFITEQARALRRFKPVFLIRDKTGEVPFEHICCRNGHGGKARATLFALTHHPLFFGHLNRIRTFKGIHAHFGFDGVYAMPLARKARIPLIVTFHGYDATVSRNALIRSGKLFQIYFHIYERRLMASAHKFIAVSKFIEQKLIQKGYPAAKIVQHYIGVNIDKIKPVKNASSNGKKKNPYILCVGRFIEKKGVDTLLRAFARISPKHGNLKLILAGDGPLRFNLARLAQRLGIASKVVFTGALMHGQVIELMQNARLVALASQTARFGESEGLPMVINEISACGVPVVATRHAGIPEAVIHGQTGFLAPERAPKTLAEYLEILITDPGLARRMGMRGREYVCDRFSIQRQTRKLEMIYQSVLSS